MNLCFSKKYNKKYQPLYLMHVRVYRLYQINLISAPSHLMSDDTSCTWYLHDVMVRYQQMHIYVYFLLPDKIVNFV
jgi:hypothetical protein